MAGWTTFVHGRVGFSADKSLVSERFALFQMDLVLVDAHKYRIRSRISPRLRTSVGLRDAPWANSLRLGEELGFTAMTAAAESFRLSSAAGC
jgi:hypothetical protein